MPILFLRDIHERNLSLEDADKVQLANELRDVVKVKFQLKKISFKKNARKLISPRKEILNNFKRKVFLTKNTEPAPEPELEPIIFTALKPTEWAKRF